MEEVLTKTKAVTFTDGPWEYVPSTEHHGPYVCGPYSGYICDCYTMTNPFARSTASGGESRPVFFQGEEADANARLIAAAPELYEALLAMRNSPVGGYGQCLISNDVLKMADAALAKARGEQE